MTGEDSEALRLTALLFIAGKIDAGSGANLLGTRTNYLDQITRGVYPDVKELPGIEGKYNKATIDTFFDELYMTPVMSDRVYYILHNAHDISERWQNALLKTLEEPPSRVSFILTATSRDKLLPTIVSRCAVMDGDVFSTEQLYNELSKHYAAGSELQSAVMSAGGKLTEAVRNLDNPVTGIILDTVLNMLINLNKSPQLAAHVSSIAVYADQLPYVLSQMATAIRDAMCVISGEEQLITFKYKSSRIKELADKLQIITSLTIITAIEHAIIRHRQNGHAISVIEELLMKILEAKNKVNN